MASPNKSPRGAAPVAPVAPAPAAVIEESVSPVAAPEALLPSAPAPEAEADPAPAPEVVIEEPVLAPPAAPPAPVAPPAPATPAAPPAPVAIVGPPGHVLARWTGAGTYGGPFFTFPKAEKKPSATGPTIGWFPEASVTKLAGQFEKL